MIFFKHCYWPEAHKWGVLGLPKSQGAAKALREYRRGDLVLVAQTKGMEGEYSGKIFGICTLLGITGSTRELANPDALTASETIA
jgi:predicted transcriptional regulator